MSNSFHSAMNDLMMEDAGRMSGRDFAEVRGVGVARRVRTRRTVRAASVGGVSAVAVGALAVGAGRLPFVADLMPASSPETEVTPTSPFQCGFEFPTDSQGSDGFWIDGLAWLTPAQMNAAVYQRRAQTNQAQIDRGGPAEPQPWDLPRAIGAEPGPVFTLHYPAGSEGAGGEFRDTDPALDPPDSNGIQGPSDVVIYFSVGQTFVAVSDGVVSGTMRAPWSPEDAPHLTQVAWGESHFLEPLALLNPEGAFTACPGATLSGDEDLYAVAGVMTDSSVDGLSEPEYAWSEVPAP